MSIHDNIPASADGGGVSGTAYGLIALIAVVLVIVAVALLGGA